MLRVPVQKHQREMEVWRATCAFLTTENEKQAAAWRKLCGLLEAAHESAIAVAGEIEEIAPLILPPAPEPRPLPAEPAPRLPVFLLIEPPADMSTLPPAARQAVLGAALGMGGGKGRPASTAEVADLGGQAVAQICCACVVGVARVGADGKETIESVQVRPAHAPAPGVLPLAAIDLEERISVQKAVQSHLATFRDLL